jgi:DNA-directed RNA polymerase specialized sigma24 family protein
MYAVGGIPVRATPVDEVEITAADADGFDAFYRSEQRQLYQLGYVLTGSGAVAEELVQETMLRVLRRWRRVRELEYPAGWARRVLINLATSRGRRLAVEARALVRLRGDRRPEPVPAADTAAVWEAVRRLPRREHKRLHCTTSKT